MRTTAFIARFALLYLAFEGAYFLIPDAVLKEVVHHHGILVPCAALLNWLGAADVVAAGDGRLTSARATLEIVRGCDGAGAMFLLVAAILATGSSLRTTLPGIVGAVGLAYALNAARIATLYFVAVHRDPWFHPLHDFVLPGFVVVASLLYFVAWDGTPQSRAIAHPAPGPA